MNMALMEKALDAAHKVIAIGPDYYLNNGPRFGRRARADRCVKSYQELAVSLRTGYLLFSGISGAYGTAGEEHPPATD
jgi:hypothetical protein